MKKTLTALLVCIGSLAYSQSHDVSINLAPMVLANYSGNYFYNFSENMGVGSTVGYHNLKLGDFTWKGVYVVPEFRYYWDPDGDNDGKYIGAYLKYRSMSSIATQEEYDYTTGTTTTSEYGIKASGLAVGIVGGRMWASRGGLTFHSWSGLGFFMFDNVSYVDIEEPEETTNIPSIDWRLGISIGWRFGGSSGHGRRRR